MPCYGLECVNMLWAQQKMASDKDVKSAEELAKNLHISNTCTNVTGLPRSESDIQMVIDKAVADVMKHNSTEESEEKTEEEAEEKAEESQESESEDEPIKEEAESEVVHENGDKGEHPEHQAAPSTSPKPQTQLETEPVAQAYNPDRFKANPCWPAACTGDQPVDASTTTPVGEVDASSLRMQGGTVIMLLSICLIVTAAFL